MGGNALKDFGARRYEKEEYLKTEQRVLTLLYSLGFRAYSIPYVREKISFGDLDLIVDGHNIDSLLGYLKRNNVPFKKNGNVISFLFEELQVDAIITKSENVDFSLKYFSHNDLGNLMGRFAHKMGCKLGHDGLWYVVREKSNKLGEICLTKNFDIALRYIGYNPEEFHEGFDTYEDMFHYVANHEKFSPSIFDLNNRNHIARTRDRKRPSYTAFLLWISENKNILNDFDWDLHPKESFIDGMFAAFPEAKQEYDMIKKEARRRQEARSKFSAFNMMHITGLEGQEIGGLVRRFKERASPHSMYEFILMTEIRDLEKMTIEIHQEMVDELKHID